MLAKGGRDFQQRGRRVTVPETVGRLWAGFGGRYRSAVSIRACRARESAAQMRRDFSALLFSSRSRDGCRDFLALRQIVFADTISASVREAPPLVGQGHPPFFASRSDTARTAGGSHSSLLSLLAENSHCAKTVFSGTILSSVREALPFGVSRAGASSFFASRSDTARTEGGTHSSLLSLLSSSPSPFSQKTRIAPNRFR